MHKTTINCSFTNYVLEEIEKMTTLGNWKVILGSLTADIVTFMADSSSFTRSKSHTEKSPDFNLHVSDFSSSIAKSICSDQGTLLNKPNTHLQAFIEKPTSPKDAHYTLLQLDSGILYTRSKTSNVPAITKSKYITQQRIDGYAVVTVMMNNLLSMSLRMDNDSLTITISGVVTFLENDDVVSGTVLSFNVWPNNISSNSQDIFTSALMYDNPFIQIMSNGNTTTPVLATVNLT